MGCCTAGVPWQPRSNDTTQPTNALRTAASIRPAGVNAETAAFATGKVGSLKKTGEDVSVRRKARLFPLSVG